MFAIVTVFTTTLPIISQTWAFDNDMLNKNTVFTKTLPIILSIKPIVPQIWDFDNDVFPIDTVLPRLGNLIIICFL